MANISTFLEIASNGCQKKTKMSLGFIICLTIVMLVETKVVG